MADLNNALECPARGNTAPVVYSPMPIRKMVPSHRLPILKTFSFCEIPQLDTLLVHQRPYKSLVDKSSYPSLDDAHSDVSDTSIEQRCCIDRLCSPDFLEDTGFLGEVLPPSRASNPQVHDKEFLKMDNHKPSKPLAINRRKGLEKLSLLEQEP